MLRQEFDEGLRQIVEFVLVDRAVRTQAPRHTLRHQLHRGTIQRGARGRHLLHDGVTVAPLGDHPLNRRDLSLDAAQPPLNLLHDVLAELQFLCVPLAPGCAYSRFTVGCHAPTILPRAAGLQYPRGYGIYDS